MHINELKSAVGFFNVFKFEEDNCARSVNVDENNRKYHELSYGSRQTLPLPV